MTHLLSLTATYAIIFGMGWLAWVCYRDRHLKNHPVALAGFSAIAEAKIWVQLIGTLLFLLALLAVVL